LMKLSRFLAMVVLVGAAFGLSGCGYFLPQAGPSSVAIDLGQLSPSGLQYGFVKITPDVIDRIAQSETWGIAGAFADNRPPAEIKFGIGDVLSVSIFEAAAGGLFIPIEAGVRPGNFVTLPNQPVDTLGNITVPYAGPVRAAGRTPTQVQATIVSALANRAIEPQAIVALATQNTSLISVLGEVNTPSRFPAQSAGEHILDALSRAGGIKDQGYDNWVVLERQGRRAAVPFGALIYQPKNNIWVHPGDTIYVYREPQTFLAFGAFAFGAATSSSSQQAQFAFDKWRITLAEALAKTGGLLDNQADPASVYLYRREPRELAELLGVDCFKFNGPFVPIIYNISLRDPAGYFLTTKFPMRDHDIIFAANAHSVEVSKLLDFLQTAIVTYNDVALAGVNTEEWRVLSHQR
jgi:polysaccharide biosynthesis/export protein